MFYGRVDVYWPDGPIESYRLSKPSVAVGRSPGNDIVLDTTAVSRYHITLSVKDQQAVLEDLDSVNGTYVDGRRIEPRAHFPVRGGEEIQVGDIRLIYHPPVSLDEDTAVPEGETTQRIVLAQPDYRVELEGPDMPVAPGAHVQARLKIENLSEEADRFFVEIDGLPKGWVRLDRVELEIEPGEQAQAVLSIKPLRRSESLPGEHPFFVRVRSRSRPQETIDVPRTLHVLPFSGFGMALGEATVEEHGEFKLYLHNQGNAPLPLTLQGADPERQVQVALSAAQLTLGPGERRTLTGRAALRARRWLGAERAHEFDVVARAGDASGFVASVPGRLVERGALPPWTPLLILPALALLIALAAGVILLALGRDEEPPAAPAIASFALGQSSVALGAPLTVNWQVTDADALRLLVGHAESQQQYDLAPGAGSFSLSFDQTGLYNLTLQATHGDELAATSAAVEVLPLVALQLEVLDANGLVRNVQGDVRLRWSVSGARDFDGDYRIWIESADRAAPLLDAPLAASGQAVVSVVPRGEQSDWLVTLYAEGRDRVVARVPQSVPIAYPTCELAAAQTIIRSGPGAAYPALVPPLQNAGQGSVALSPLARDPSGAWLQVRIGVENPRLGWAPLADFACANFDPARLVVSNDFPPAPATPTLAPSATPAPATPTLPPSATPRTLTPARTPSPAAPRSP